MTAAHEKLPELAADEAAGLRWWVCRCGRHFHEHSSRTLAGGGGTEYVCSSTVSGRFESETRRVAYDPNRGLQVRPETLLDPEPKLQ